MAIAGPGILRDLCPENNETGIFGHCIVCIVNVCVCETSRLFQGREVFLEGGKGVSDGERKMRGPEGLRAVVIRCAAGPICC